MNELIKINTEFQGNIVESVIENSPLTIKEIKFYEEIEQNKLKELIDHGIHHFSGRFKNFFPGDVFDCLFDPVRYKFLLKHLINNDYVYMRQFFLDRLELEKQIDTIKAFIILRRNHNDSFDTFQEFLDLNIPYPVIKDIAIYSQIQSSSIDSYQALNRRLYHDIQEHRVRLLVGNIHIDTITNTEKFEEMDLQTFFSLVNSTSKVLHEERRLKAVDFANIACIIAAANGNKSSELEDFIPWADLKQTEVKQTINHNPDHTLNPISLACLDEAKIFSAVPLYTSNVVSKDETIKGRCELRRNPFRHLTSNYITLIDTYPNATFCPILILNPRYARMGRIPKHLKLFDGYNKKRYIGTIKYDEAWHKMSLVADCEIEWIDKPKLKLPVVK